MARPVDQGALVFWHSPRRVTFWLNAYDGNGGDARLTLDNIISDRSPDAFDEIEEAIPGVLRYSYRLREVGGGGAVASLNGFVIAEDGGFMQIGAYFDDERDVNVALSLWRSFRASV